MEHQKSVNPVVVVQSVLALVVAVTCTDAIRDCVNTIKPKFSIPAIIHVIAAIIVIILAIFIVEQVGGLSCKVMYEPELINVANTTPMVINNNVST